jgi:hypothetical protein
MELTFRFLDNANWSYYGTLNVAIPLFLFIIFKQRIDLQALIFMSLLGMMDGDLISKILFVGFLNLLVYNSSTEWLIRSIILILSVYLMNFVKINNPIHQFVMNSEPLQWLMRIIILIWVLYIFYIMYGSLKFWK